MLRIRLFNAKNISYKFVITVIPDIFLEVKGCICFCPETGLLISITLPIMQSYLIVNHKLL